MGNMSANMSGNQTGNHMGDNMGGSSHGGGMGGSMGGHGVEDMAVAQVPEEARVVVPVATPAVVVAAADDVRV